MAELIPSSLNPQLLFQQLNVLFQDAYQHAESFYDRENWVLQRQSATLQEVYLWMDRLPAMRQWIGPRAIVNASLRTYSLTNVDYELTIALDRNILKDAKVDVFAPVVTDVAAAAKRKADLLIASMLVNGNAATSLCHDGQPFFSTSHPIDIDNPSSSTQSNYFASGYALNAANYYSVRTAMRNMSASDGTPLGIKPDLLVVPPALEQQALSILNTAWFSPATGYGQVAAGAPSQNTLQGTARLLVNDYLGAAFGGSDSTWYLFDSSKAAKAILWQQLQAPQLVSKSTNPSDQEMFWDKQFVYGIDMRAAAGYGIYFLAAKAAA